MKLPPRIVIAYAMPDDAYWFGRYEAMAKLARMRAYHAGLQGRYREMFSVLEDARMWAKHARTYFARMARSNAAALKAREAAS